MFALREILTRMQSQPTGCVAVLLVDLRDGRLLESCGEDTITHGATVARIMRELAAPRHVLLPGLSPDVPQEVIVLADDSAYVCQRLADPPHHAIAAICRDTHNLGMVVALLHNEIETDA